MAKDNIKRYSMEEIAAMNERGAYMPTAADAPEFELGDEFWKKARRVGADGDVGSSVKLTLKPDTLAYFRDRSPDPLARMAEVLDEHAKKAS